MKPQMLCNTNTKRGTTRVPQVPMRLVRTIKQTAVAALTLTLLPMAVIAADDGRAPIRVINAQERQRMADYLTQHVYPRDIVAGFTTVAGDEVDCVDIHAQPALRRPGMERHVIEFAPKTFPKAERQGPLQSLGAGEQSDKVSSEAVVVAPPIGSPNEQCPHGSVPLRRLTMDTLQRFRTLEDFRKKVPSHIGQVRDGELDRMDDKQIPADDLVPPRIGASSLHQYAHAYQYVANWGAETVLNLWNPYVERSDEFSLSQMWVVRSSGANTETVEAGWQKYRDLYGDWNARLFIYFTPLL